MFVQVWVLTVQKCGFSKVVSKVDFTFSIKLYFHFIPDMVCMLFVFICSVK